MIDEARKNETERISVVLKLASWTEKSRSFEEWLLSELMDKYGIPTWLCYFV